MVFHGQTPWPSLLSSACRASCCAQICAGLEATQGTAGAKSALKQADERVKPTGRVGVDTFWLNGMDMSNGGYNVYNMFHVPGPVSATTSECQIKCQDILYVKLNFSQSVRIHVRKNSTKMSDGMLGYTSDRMSADKVSEYCMDLQPTRDDVWCLKMGVSTAIYLNPTSQHQSLFWGSGALPMICFSHADKTLLIISY